MDAERLTAAGIPQTGEQLALVDVLRGARAVQDEGVETVEKVPARRYAFEVDLKAAVCAAPADRRGILQELLRAPPGLEVSMSAEAWVDEFALVRRLRITAALDAARTVSYELLLPGDNATQAVQPPPEDQVVPLDEVPKLATLVPEAATPALVTC